MDHATEPRTPTRPTPSQARKERRRRSRARRAAETLAARPGDDALAGFPPLVRLLACRRSAVVAVEGLADHLGRDVEQLWDEVQDLERRGDVSAWPDHPLGPVVALSSRSAAALGLRLNPAGNRWDVPEPAVRGPRGRRRKAGAVAAGPTPGAEAAMAFDSVVTIVVAAGA